ncbi:Serine/threonine-protein kinase AFC3 like [Verticillium longisporum]|uniref:Serine/threonine-protein kinase AFC3 like n=1 Tax=Verticillium longisporum TaxID=100787 RepID=A0A8I3A0P7_VERLO|nr:Serine/threonine-protein kinase AFC3 like [Verticillium longisporum]
MLGIEDDSVFTAFEEEELSDPSPRKTVDGRSIYVSRELQLPKAWGAPVLCDFGSAVIGEIEHLEDVQPDIYRAPEVIVEAPWSYSIDIWNTGCVYTLDESNANYDTILVQILLLTAKSFIPRI